MKQPPVIKEYVPVEQAFWNKVISSAIAMLLTAVVSYIAADEDAWELVTSFWADKEERTPSLASPRVTNSTNVHAVAYFTPTTNTYTMFKFRHCDIEKAYASNNVIYVFGGWERLPGDGRVVLKNVRCYQNTPDGRFEEVPIQTGELP